MARRRGDAAATALISVPPTSALIDEGSREPEILNFDIDVTPFEDAAHVVASTSTGSPRAVKNVCGPPGARLHDS